MFVSSLLTLALVTLAQSATAESARTAFFDRVLKPVEAPAAAAAASPADKNAQKAFEAVEAYRKGLIYVQQGAWREAETAFHDAERKDDKVPEYRLAAAFAYLKTHKPNDAYRRYEAFYKKDPADARALAGMIAAREEAQLYREAVALWQRYVRLPLPSRELAEANALLDGARELFAERYEIAENPAGGAPNLATPEQELSWGLGYVKELSDSGMSQLADRATVAYVEQLCQRLVKRSKLFPTNYQLFVLDTASVNAVTVPGFIFVYRGLLDAAPSEAALAGVLAHEIGHSVAHHTAKKVTRSFQDQQQLERLQASNNKLSQFLAKMLQSGNPVGALSFSRDAEAQADRLGVHIAFDTGFDPTGLAEMFQIFEQMSPSSRNSWDLMARTHPFSIDRINAVREYAALLPARPLVKTTPAFKDMKTRLAKLPPAPDATGLMKAPEPPPATRPPAKTTPYSLAPAPFSGQMPDGWVAKKQSAQTTIFSAPAGTPEAEASVWIRLATRVSQPDWKIDDFVDDLQRANAKLADLEWGLLNRQQTEDGRAIRILEATWSNKTSAGAMTSWQSVFVFAEFPDYMAVGQYSAPKAYFERLSNGFGVIWKSLTYGAAPSTSAPATSSGRLAFTIESPPYGGEMPEGWTARRTDDFVIIEGAQGTEPYEMTIRVAFYEKKLNTLDKVASNMRAALAGLPDATVTAMKLTATSEGRPARGFVADYAGRDASKRSVPFRQVIAIVEYPSHLVVLGYFGPASLHDKYAGAFEMVGSTLRERR